MENTEEQIKEENPVEENVLVDIDDGDQKNIDTKPVVEKEEERTNVRTQESDDELDEYSENVQKRINQLTAKRKQALEEADAAYRYAEEQKKQNEELQKKLEQLNTGYTSEFSNRIEAQSEQAKKLYKEAIDAGDA